MKITHSPSVHLNLVSAWLDFNACPTCPKALDRLGQAIDASVRANRPSDSFGALRDHSKEIWQDARILLLHSKDLFGRRHRKNARRQGYLAGNPMLREATQRGDIPEVSRQLERSVLAATDHCHKRMRRVVALRDKIHRCLDEVLEYKLGSSRPWGETELHDLPSAVLKELAITLLQRALADGDLSKTTMAIAIRVLVDGMCQTNAAREYGVSRQAIHQRLRRVRSWLKHNIPQVEVPVQ
jgi:hypothetical protein